MSSNIVVGYDGTPNADKALDFAVSMAKAQGANLIVAHVLEWSPYSFLTPTELEERHKRREEELERADKAIIAPAMARLKDSGVQISSMVKYGNIAATLIGIAQEATASQIVLGRTDGSEMSSRLFGSVTISMSQASPLPLTIVP